MTVVRVKITMIPRFSIFIRISPWIFIICVFSITWIRPSSFFWVVLSTAFFRSRFIYVLITDGATFTFFNFMKASVRAFVNRVLVTTFSRGIPAAFPIDLVINTNWARTTFGSVWNWLGNSILSGYSIDLTIFYFSIIIS